MQLELTVLLCNYATTLVLLLEIIQVVVTDTQQQGRRLFSWLLQTARGLNSEVEPKAFSPVDTERILGMLEAAALGQAQGQHL